MYKEMKCSRSARHIASTIQRLTMIDDTIITTITTDTLFPYSDQISVMVR